MQPRAVKHRDFPSSGDQSPLAQRYPQPISHHRDVELSNNLYSQSGESVAAGANVVAFAGDFKTPLLPSAQRFKPLYTPEERRRRDATKWTLVQGILAPIQFAAFLISLGLVVRYLTLGDGLSAATASILIKTLLLYAIMVTGSIWEREVFGCYLFAPAFFWEDVFSFLVLALAAYASYFVNATQFILKLRAARRDERIALASAPSAGSHA